MVTISLRKVELQMTEVTGNRPKGRYITRISV